MMKMITNKQNVSIRHICKKNEDNEISIKSPLIVRFHLGSRYKFTKILFIEASSRKI